MGRYILSAVALAACYDPTIQLGGVCTPPDGVCPAGQVCSAEGVCTMPGRDAAGEDAPRDPDSREIDASSDAGILPAWRLVQVHSTTAPSGGSPSLAVTLTSTLPGDLLVVGIQTAPGATITNVSDDAESAYSAIVGSMASNATGDGGVDIWYTPSANAGATSVVATTSDAIYDVVVWDFATAQPSTVDAVKALSDQAASTMPMAPPVTTERAGELVIAIAISAGTVTAIQTGNEFTNDSKANGNGFAHLTSATAAAGDHQAAWDSNSATYCSTAVAFHVGE
ncbi:MAG TPA: hypothetical protein VGG28_33890 [Kofleriaceae bacterium]|jgi:hypothetical protein